MVPRSTQFVTVAAIVVAAATGLATNYASEDLPGWLSDPLVRWLLLGVLVLASIVVTLLVNRVPRNAPAPAFNAPTGSLTPPAPDVVALRGRDRETRRLRELVARPRGRFVVISGVGGMGKTALARAVSDQARRDGRTVLWMRWRSLEQLTGQMLEAATLLGLSEARIGAAQHSGASLPDLVWSHLGRTNRWVIVVDNLDQPEDAAPAGEQLREYRGWLRPTGAGLLVVTSRDRDPRIWGQQAELITLDPLDPTTGAQVLRDAAPNAGPAEELAARLGGLPLALHAAAAVVAAPATRYQTFAAYAAALADRTERLLPERPDTTDPDVVRRLVGHTWELSLDQLAEQGHPLARPLLRLLALYADAPIPRGLVTPDLFTPDVRTDAGLSEATITPAVVDAALAGLHRYGLVDAPHPDTTSGVATVVLHPMVRGAAADLLGAETDPTPWREASEAALIALIREVSEAGRAGWDTARLLPPHAIRLTGLRSADDEAFRAARDPTERLAGLLQDAGAHRLAHPIWEAVLTAETRQLGADHPGTLSSRSNLAIGLSGLGQYRQAAELHRRTLADYERIFGSDHPNTLSSRNNLATSLSDLGQHDQAAELHRCVLSDRERVLGPAHPNTLSSRNNLAVALSGLGRYEDAVKLDRRTLADRERILGPDHPSTLDSRNNLAAALSELGEYAEAADLHRRTLTDYERIFGSDHPWTLNSRYNLASTLSELGRHEEAADLHRRTVADSERVLGPDHPSTLTSRNNLAATLLDLGRLREAAALFERNLADRERVLGPDHPLTHASRERLATARRTFAKRRRRLRWR